MVLKVYMMVRVSPSSVPGSASVPLAPATLYGI